MKGKLFEIQPEYCRAPLPRLKIEWSDWYKERPELIERLERVLFLDPTDLYRRVGHLIDPYKRIHGIGMEDMFPKQHIICACGCGKNAKASDTFKEDGVTPTWQRKWASDECSAFAGACLSIINNTFQVPSKYITFYYGKKCECGKEGYDLELDHTVGVKHGGGGSWLSNYKWLCKNCHNCKTNKDFGRKSHKGISKEQVKLNFE
ncbi:MAG: HNH endonuclease signature motif containing protein [Bacteroidota bacterium]